MANREAYRNFPARWVIHLTCPLRRWIGRLTLRTGLSGWTKGGERRACPLRTGCIVKSKLDMPR